VGRAKIAEIPKMLVKRISETEEWIWGRFQRISERKVGIAEISSELVRRISKTESRFEEILDD
jgi:hypothetical protein